MSPSADELRSLDWRSLIAESDSRSCDALHKTLCRWVGEGNLASNTKASWLSVEQILALHLHIDPDVELPFVPTDIIRVIERDFLRAFSQMVSEIESPDLQARVLDLAWLVRVCDHAQVRLAVAAYMSSADEHFDPNQWLHSFTRIQRALTLAASMGTKQKLFTATVDAIEDRLDRVGVDDPLWLTHRLMELLLRFQVGDAACWAERSHRIAQLARKNYETHGIGNGLECERERSYLDLEIAWRRRLGEDDSVHLLTVEVGDAFVRQAEGVIAAGWPNAKSVASHFVGCAIGRLRESAGLKSKVDALRLRQQVLQREALAEMRSMNVSIDLTETIKSAKAQVAGKPAAAALVALAFIHEPPSAVDIEEEVRRNAADHPISAMLPQSYLGPRGTVLAEHAGVMDQDDTTGFQLETMRTAHTRQSLIASAVLHVAAEQIRVEHGLDTSWFFGLARSSEFVPARRERSFARGLSAGLRGDYEVASAILVPQFEHAVRELFFRRHIVTATLPASGAQNEHDLNTLLKHPRAGEIFGDAVVFDLRVLLIEKAGANLRNAVAHGLLDDGEYFGPSVYFWWICLRLVLLPLVTSANAAAGTSPANEAGPGCPNHSDPEGSVQ